MKAGNVGYWNIRKEKLLKLYKNLSQKDLEFKLGEENEMLAVLSNKLGLPHQEVLRIIVTL
jgi:hypothetical protein